MSGAAPSGWADDRLMQAYDAVYATWEAHKGPDDSLPELKSILVDIEAADHQLAAVIKERVA